MKNSILILFSLLSFNAFSMTPADEILELNENFIGSGTSKFKCEVNIELNDVYNPDAYTTSDQSLSKYQIIVGFESASVFQKVFLYSSQLKVEKDWLRNPKALVYKKEVIYPQFGISWQASHGDRFHPVDSARFELNSESKITKASVIFSPTKWEKLSGICIRKD